tara:strand:+ start:409 stop:783 length:375 start_codon:yes stop_codon:yes gene_type:complete
MYLLILIAISTLVIVFIYNGFATRCPKCGSFGLHKKNKEATMQKLKSNINIKDLLDRVNSSYENPLLQEETSLSKSAQFNEAIFNCKACKYEFNRKKSLIWLTTSNKLGDEIAIKEYNKLLEEE